MQAFQPPARLPLHLLDRAEADRLRGTRLRAGRHQVELQPVVAECALEGTSVAFAAVDHPEGAGGDAVAAAVAHVRLDHDRAELGAEDGACWADLQAGGIRTMLADVRVHQPADIAIALLLDERDVAPGVGAQTSRVVVGVGQEVQPVVRQQVPLLAGDLAGLAADADRAVGEEADAGHLPRLPGLMSQVAALHSWMWTLGSSTIESRSLAESPRERPRPPQ